MSNISAKDAATTKEYIRDAMTALVDCIKTDGKKDGVDIAVYLEICGTQNVCRLAYTHFNGDPPDIFTLTITVRRRNTDRDYTQFDFTGTEEQFFEYVSKPVYDFEEFYDRIMNMSDKADEYWEEVL